jgi:hypothetical protein
MSSPRVWVALSCLVVGTLLAAPARAASITENFDSVAALAARGWETANNSSPVGPSGWFQGQPVIFSSQSGAPDSYIATNFVSAGTGGDISNWLFSPVMQFDNGNSVSFYTRTVDDPIAPDRLEVRLSGNAASINVGGTAASVGDFSQLLLTVNPLLTTAGYPSNWTQYVLTISGLAAPTWGRLGFRYFVPDTNVNGDYIGIDTFETDALPTPEPATLGLLALGLAGGIVRRVRRGNVRTSR